MSHEKLIKLARNEGFCCMWAFLETHKDLPTGKLVEAARAAGIRISARAIRHQRRAFRREQTKCENLTRCLLLKIQASGKTSPRSQ